MREEEWSTYPAVSTCSHYKSDFSVAEEETRLTRKYPQYPFVPSVKEERDGALRGDPEHPGYGT